VCVALRTLYLLRNRSAHNAGQIMQRLCRYLPPTNSTFIEGGGLSSRPSAFRCPGALTLQRHAGTPSSCHWLNASQADGCRYPLDTRKYPHHSPIKNILCTAVIAPRQAVDPATRRPASSPLAESVCADRKTRRANKCRMQKSAGAPTLSWIKRNRSTIAARRCATSRYQRL
jgi:hypothetical protein